VNGVKQSHPYVIAMNEVKWQSQFVSLRAKRGNLIKRNVFFIYEIAALSPVVRNDKKRSQSNFSLRDCHVALVMTHRGWDCRAAPAMTKDKILKSDKGRNFGEDIF
jgi:hypothetical protein